VFFVTPYVMRVNGIGWRAAWGELFAPGLLPAVPALLALYGLRAWVQPASYLTIGAVGLAGVGVYALGYLALTRGRPEQRLLRQLLTQLLARARTLARPAR